MHRYLPSLLSGGLQSSAIGVMFKVRRRPIHPCFSYEMGVDASPDVSESKVGRHAKISVLSKDALFALCNP